MKKYLIGWLLIFLTPGFANAQTKSDIKREGLLGAVRSMTLETSPFINQNGGWEERIEENYRRLFMMKKA